MKNKFSLLTLFALLLSSQLFLAQNTLPNSGNVGIGTMNPTNQLEVVGKTKLGRVNITDTLTVQKPVNLKDSLTVDKKLTVKQDVKIIGKTVMTDNVRAKSNLTVLGNTRTKGNEVVEGDTKVLGTTKMMGNGFVEGIFKFKGLADNTTTENRFLMIRPNGKAVSFNKSGMLNLLYSQPCKYDLGTASPTWVSAPGVLWTGAPCSPAKVGVGTSNPQFNLDVVGTAHISSLLKIGNNSIYIGSTNQNTGTNNKIYATDDLLIQSDVNNSFNTIINYNNTGNVGIGMNAPAHKLEVAGTVRACKFIAEANSWCDYVFEADYDLMPLQEVEKFIKENKHLPEIPSEKTIEEDGVDVVKMETLLLKKVEELTLYMIELEKKNTELAKELLELKIAINK